jgi:hypothetical protein
MGDEITIEGIPELIAKLEAMNVKIDAVAARALREAGELVVEEAKTTTAFIDRTGKLREFLKVSQVRSLAGTKYVLAGIDKGDNSKVFYGRICRLI